MHHGGWLLILVLGCGALGCGALGCGSPAAAPPAEPGPVSRTELSEEAARDRAIEAAEQAGYDPAEYGVTSVERQGGRWLVSFEAPPPTPPGGHFGVYVDAESGETEVMPGE